MRPWEMSRRISLGLESWGAKNAARIQQAENFSRLCEVCWKCRGVYMGASPGDWCAGCGYQHPVQYTPGMFDPNRGIVGPRYHELKQKLNDTLNLQGKEKREADVVPQS